MSMQSVGEVLSRMNLHERFQLAAQAAEDHRNKMMREHGPDFDINKCWHCGGRGVLPGSGRYCRQCQHGIELQAEAQGLDQLKTKWQVAIPSRFREYRFATHPNQKAADAALRWFREGFPQGQNLYLGGPVGTGKTGLAIAALWAAHQSGKSIHYTTIPDMLTSLRPADPGQERNDISMHALQTVDLLLLDDMGAEKPTEWTAAQQYQVINGRYHNQLPTIVTTNVRPAELAAEDKIGPRTMSRLGESMRTVWVDGEDLRLVRTHRSAK